MPEKPYFLVNADNKTIASQYNYMEDDLTLQRSKANTVGRTFTDFDGNISVKSDYNRRDYEYFRANLTDLTVERSIDLAQKAYEKVGIIRNIVDTMSDLGGQGVRVQHPVRKIERFYQAWYEYVGGVQVSERFLNMFYRLCNVPVKSAYGTISFRNEDEWSKTKAGLEDAMIETPKIAKRSIPLRYTFLPPSSLEVIGGAASLFVGKPYYVLKVTDVIKAQLAKINGIGIAEVRDQYQKMTNEIRSAIQGNSKYIALDQDKIDVYFYKKDDWQVWALPYIASIFDDLQLLERFKLADMSATDGAIQSIRHWKVGIIDPANPQNNILPTKTAINKLKNILANNIGGGTMDLVTGPEVSFEESNTNVHEFLGKEKYVVVLDNIYDGMGIPPPLRSGGGAGSSSTNNYVSLKTLVERLQYGRNALIQFWNKQLAIVAKAMGFAEPAKIMFDQIILSDEAAEKALLVQLVDRNIISDQAVQEYFGYIPGIEKARVKRENKNKETDKMPKKASQFHNPQYEEDIKKILAQAGTVTPSELGIELEERKPGEQSKFEQEQKTKVKVAKFKPVGSPLTGRPRNVTETKKRKSKPNARPRTGRAFMEDLLWAEKAYSIISDILSPAIYKSFEKSNARQLTNEESQILEDIKFRAFCALEVGEDIDDNRVREILDTDMGIPISIMQVFEESKAYYIEKHSKTPTLEEQRKMQILAYLEVNS